MNILDSDLLSIQEARILLEKAKEAREELSLTGQRRLDQAYLHVIARLKEHVDNLVALAYEETDYGSPQDEKLLFVHLLSELPKRLEGYTCVGIIEHDKERGISELGIPKGIVVSLPPAWLSLEVIVHNIVIAIKTGNPIVVVPHRRAVKTTCTLLKIIKDALAELYVPEGAVQVLTHYSFEGERELVQDPDVAVVIETCRGTTSSWKETRSKSRFKGTIGNNPVFVEKTANLADTAQQIVQSKAFMNGLLPGVEQAIVVEEAVEADFKKELISQGAYFLSDEEAHKLQEVLYEADGAPRKEAMGKSAQELAKRAQINLPSYIKVLVVDRPFVSRYSPYSKEKFAPVVSFYVEDDWRHACEKCIELILNERHGHSMSIYSQDPEVIRQFILRKPVARMMCNCSSSFGAMGISTDLFLSYTLSVSGVGGESSANLQPKHLLNCRRAAYKSRDVHKALFECSLDKDTGSTKGLQDSLFNCIGNSQLASVVSHITPCQGCIPVEQLGSQADAQFVHTQVTKGDSSWFIGLMEEMKESTQA